MNSTSRLPWLSKTQATIALGALLAVGLITSTTAEHRTTPLAAEAVGVHPSYDHNHANRSGSTTSYDDESDWWCGDDEGDGWYDESSYDDCGYDDGSYDDGSYDDGSYDDGSYDDGSYDDTSSSSSSSADSTLLATFPVVAGRLVTTGKSASATKAANAIWARFTTLIPADRRTMLASFELRSRKYNGAYVYLEKRTNLWTLGVQDGVNDPQELDYILVHEFGHLLTLNAGQMQLKSTAKTCATAYFYEGCAKPDSMTARYMAQFWPAEWRRIADTEDNDLADRSPSSFVSSYAATNPSEDMAETFATFVVDAKPTRNRVADQKLNFFWAIPEMVQLRDQIRASMV